MLTIYSILITDPKEIFMEKGNVMYGQSGGPSAVINSSLYGVVEAALENENVGKFYGAVHGIDGILNEEFFEFKKENLEDYKRLKFTPGAFLGSVRHKLKKVEEDVSEYERILEVFSKYNIRYFFYNGGNDSMDTCDKVSKFLASRGYKCNVIGIPKTIDNDLVCTDHTPGFGSAAKYIATSLMELACDTNVYKTGRVTIVEIMGRDTGWLAASSYVATHFIGSPDLIYLPENTFSTTKFLQDVKKVYDQKKKALVVVSEGIVGEDGVEIGASGTKDAFGHSELTGAASNLSKLINKELGIKTRFIELSLLQRGGAHIGDQVDVEEAVQVGRAALTNAVNGVTDVMIGIKRLSDKPYKVEYECVPLSNVANAIKYVDEKYMNSEKNHIDSSFLDYVMPLVQGENKVEFKDGVPNFIVRK